MHCDGYDCVCRKANTAAIYTFLTRKGKRSFLTGPHALHSNYLKPNFIPPPSRTRRVVGTGDH